MMTPDRDLDPGDGAALDSEPVGGG